MQHPSKFVASGRPAAASLLVFATLALAGCGHHRQTVAYAPPPPGLQPPPSARPVAPRPVAPIAAPPAGNASDAEIVASGAPIYSETGLASWYGPPYHNRQGANGKIFDQNALSAAHRTLPMNSLIRVTNLATGQSAVMRVTDRGPFVPDRILDLSVASAKAVGVWRPGTAQVRIDVFDAPKPIGQGGRWCVQVGAFLHEGEAKKLEKHLSDKYKDAEVIEFTGPTGHWVRIKPENYDKAKAIEIARNMNPGEKDAMPYLVRLD